MTDLADLTLTEASILLERGEISSYNLVSATLRRMDETEPTVHAYAHRLDDAALARAKAADTAPRTGPLHGIPFAVKDTLHTKGTPTEAGSPLLHGQISAYDATVVERLRAAGAILVGKHTTHEFALGHDVAPTRNPWDLTRFPGGSSAGSGASVAAGSSMLGIGTDAGGSTRMPAAFTGVVGLKPTYGRISTYGTVPGAAVPGAEHIGLFTRTAQDCALVLPVVSGPDPRDPRTVDFPPFSAPAADGIGGLRIGVVRQVYAGQQVTAGIASLLAAVGDELAGLGATLVDVELSLEQAGAALTLLVAAGAAASHLPELRRRPEQYSCAVRQFLQASLLIPARHLRAAQSARTALRRHVAETYRAHQLDVLLMPTLPSTAPRMDQWDPATDTGELTAFTSVWNLTGQPAISLPCGLAADGMPVGAQVVGRPLGEAAVLRVGMAYQSVTSWHLTRPLIPAAS